MKFTGRYTAATAEALKGSPRPPAAGLPICRRAGRSRRRGYLPRPVSSPDKLS